MSENFRLSVSQKRYCITTLNTAVRLDLASSEIKYFENKPAYLFKIVFFQTYISPLTFIWC